MSLSDVARVNITRETSAPSQVGFGKELIMSYHTVFTERAREYTSVDGMTDDGFALTDPAVRKAQAVFAQNPHPPSVIVGREENTVAKVIKITPVSTNLKASSDYILYLNGKEAKFTTDATPTVAEICTGMVASVDALGEAVTTADNTTDFTITADVAGVDFRLEIADRKIMHQKNTTADGSPNGIVADIQAVRAENDDWYIAHLCHQGEACILAAAAYMETLVRGLIVTSADDEILDSTVTTDVASDLATAGYVRTLLSHHPKAETQNLDARWAGACLPYDPGSYTWNMFTLTGVDYVEYTTTEKATMESKYCNYYTQISGKSITQTGITPGGEWFDIINGIDWTQIRMQEALFGRLAAARKVPYTDPGAAILEGEIKGVLQKGVTRDIYAADPAPEVEVPLVSTQSVANRAARIFGGITFRATVAGAIHEVVVNGTVTV